MCLWINRVRMCPKRRGTYTHTLTYLFLYSPELVKRVRLVWVTNSPPDHLSRQHKHQPCETLAGFKQNERRNIEEIRALKGVFRSRWWKKKRASILEQMERDKIQWQKKCRLELCHWAECKCAHRHTNQEFVRKCLLTAQCTSNAVSSETNDVAKNDSQNCCQK